MISWISKGRMLLSNPLNKLPNVVAMVDTSKGTKCGFRSSGALPSPDPL